MLQLSYLNALFNDIKYDINGFVFFFTCPILYNYMTNFPNMALYIYSADLTMLNFVQMNAEKSLFNSSENKCNQWILFINY